MQTLNDIDWSSRTRQILAFLASLSLVLASGCTGSDDGAPAPGPDETAASDGATAPETEATASTPAPEDIDDEFEAAIAAYERYRDVLDAASAIPDPDYPQLAEVAADDGLAAAQQIVQRLADAGLRNTGKHLNDFTIKDWAPEEHPTQVALITCSDSSQTQIVDATTGEPAPGEEYGKRHVEALVELRTVQDDAGAGLERWLVVDLAVQELGSC